MGIYALLLSKSAISLLNLSNSTQLLKEWAELELNNTLDPGVSRLPELK